MPSNHAWGDSAYPWGSFVWGGVIQDFPTGVLVDSKHFHAKREGRGFQSVVAVREYYPRRRKRAFMYQLEEEWQE